MNNQTADIRQRATLLSSVRMTPASSPEEVRELSFRSADLGFDGQPGQCIRVLAPGQYGNLYHPRLYSLAEVDRGASDHTDFKLCVRRCWGIDDFNGERFPGIASNYLCDLHPGVQIEFTGPIGYPFMPPDDPEAGLLMIGMGTGIAPFRGLIRAIYESRGNWRGPVRLFYGARSGLEMLYQNDENRDLALYFDQPTFKAFQAVSPRPHFGEPVAMEEAIARNAEEVWSLLSDEGTYVYIAGGQPLLKMLSLPLARYTGQADALEEVRERLTAAGRWFELLY